VTVAEWLSHHFHKYTNVFLGLKNEHAYGIVSWGAHIAAIKPILYRPIYARRARTAPPGGEIYVTVFRSPSRQNGASRCRWAVQ
jgi:hypothetical protein